MVIQGFDVYNSEEFKAFCKKFNICYGLLTKEITIKLPVDGPMEVTQTYLTELEPRPAYVNTTTMQNDKYVTKEPNKNACNGTNGQVSESCIVAESK